jgi:uncharacterized protein (TIGR02246 family)
MKRTFFGLAFVLISFLAATAQTASTAQKDADLLAEAKLAIEKGNAQWAEAWEKGKPEMVVEIFAEDGKLLLRSGKVVKGHSALLELYKSAMAGVGKEIKAMKVTVTTINVWLDGEMVYETGKYSYNYEENGKPTVEAGKYITIWKKQKNGAWKLFMDMGVPQD